MCLDRLDADVEDRPDLLVRPTFGDELDDGALAGGQRANFPAPAVEGGI